MTLRLIPQKSKPSGDRRATRIRAAVTALAALLDVPPTSATTLLWTPFVIAFGEEITLTQGKRICRRYGLAFSSLGHRGFVRTADFERFLESQAGVESVATEPSAPAANDALDGIDQGVAAAFRKVGAR